VFLEPAALGGRDQEADMRHTALITTVALAAGFIAPAAAGAAQWEYMYSSSPQSLEAKASQQGSQDLRSPDARDAATAASVPQDLRSPDARDAGRPPAVATPTTVVAVREVPVSGFDWGDAAIGAAVILGMCSIAGGLMLLLSGRRRRRGFQVPAH
jgi:hypothetical protein